MSRRLVYSLAMVASLSACAGSQNIPLISSPQTPAAQGTVVRRMEGDGNVKLTIEVRHLAPPEKVLPMATVYIVWVQPEGGSPQNVGVLAIDKDLTGRLTTNTVYNAFRLFITAEPSPEAPVPTGPQVLSAAVASS